MNKALWSRKTGRVMSIIILALGSASTVITVMLDSVSRGGTVVSIVNSLPGWLNSPIAGVVAIIIGYCVLWVNTPVHPQGKIFLTDGPRNYVAPFPARVKIAGVSVLSGMALGALLLVVVWLLPNSMQFKVTVKKGGETLTAAKVAKDAKELKIKLSATELRADAQEYSVTATVFYDGEPDLTIRNAEEGYVVNYPKQHGYRIELVKATSDSATFSISKNP